ncbi:NADH dehydrogenase (ubiquinone) B18 subunit [Oratosquilla oratoria]|uniref:NADH dehydrogenase (ubiquinone) B18 subunit n=1 Tax=Oratosquilla oratoria TaxID=337810 RepID=UPI003F76D611
MGSVFSNYINDPQTCPNYTEAPSFDPVAGFPDGRKERVMVATQEEMESAKLPLKDRDYCAHLAIKYQACKHNVWPFVYQCAHEKHDYLNCEYDDYVLRMKEYERERRMLERAKRKARKAAREAAEEEE